MILQYAHIALECKYFIYCTRYICPILRYIIYILLYYNITSNTIHLSTVQYINHHCYYYYAPLSVSRVILGGGVVKHHTCNANLMRNGAEYSVYINTGQVNTVHILFTSYNHTLIFSYTIYNIYIHFLYNIYIHYILVVIPFLTYLMINIITILYLYYTISIGVRWK